LRGIERVVQIGAVEMVNDRIETLENIRGVLLEVLYEVVWTHAVSSSTSEWGQTRDACAPPY
jgi:hypothetical protein